MINVDNPLLLKKNIPLIDVDQQYKSGGVVNERS